MQAASTAALRAMARRPSLPVARAAWRRSRMAPFEYKRVRRGSGVAPNLAFRMARHYRRTL